MPRPRTIIPSLHDSSHYHCVSRVVDRRFVFEAHERDVFRKVLRQVEGFSGVRVLTWTILSNHFHLLLEVPPVPAVALTDDAILERCRHLYSQDQMVAVEWEHAEAVRMGGVVLERWRARFLQRMWDLSEFMKTLKQKFTLWFNREHERVGTLWESRFRSVAIEGNWKALLSVAAYIDLNAVRAGLVDDPKDYRWSGYGEAVAGERNSRQGLAAALVDVKGDADWREVGARYRKVLFGIGEENSVRAGISRAEVARVWAAGGKLTLAQLLRCRVRYLSAGMAFGSAAFVERVFQAQRGSFSASRETGARRMRGGDWGGLRVARDLRKAVVAPPPPD